MKDYDDDADDYDTSLQPGQHMMNTQMDYKEKYHDALDAYREAVKAIDKLKGASDIDFERADQINALEDQNNALEKEVLIWRNVIRLLRPIMSFSGINKRIPKSRSML